MSLPRRDTSSSRRRASSFSAFASSRALSPKLCAAASVFRASALASLARDTSRVWSFEASFIAPSFSAMRSFSV